jgi:hypothetical protein
MVNLDLTRTSTLTSAILLLLQSLAAAEDFITLTSDKRLQRLQNAQIVAQSILNLENRDLEIKERT